MNESESNEHAYIIRDCLNLEIKEDRKFVQSVEKILYRCLAEDEVDEFSKMLDYIDKNYMRSDLTYEEVAKAGNVSKTYLSKMFRAKLGVSYVEYIVQVRLDRACILLRSTDYSIGDISKMVGYDNLSSFGRAFKVQFGMSAVQYRKQQGGNKV